MTIENTLNVGICDFCNKLKINNTYFIYRILIKTNKREYYKGLLKFSNQLGNYLISKNILLSSTQVILLRPDIVIEYLNLTENLKNNEFILFFFLEKSEICYHCFEDIKKEVPKK